MTEEELAKLCLKAASGAVKEFMSLEDPDAEFRVACGTAALLLAGAAHNSNVPVSVAAIRMLQELPDAAGIVAGIGQEKANEKAS